MVAYDLNTEILNTLFYFYFIDHRVRIHAFRKNVMEEEL